MAKGDVNFSVDGVIKSMDKLNALFDQFSDELKNINSYIQTNVNVSIDSAVFGNYGAKMLSIWDQNASTFGDFHANFTAWSEAVSIVASAKGNFVLDVESMYRNNGGNLDGIVAARDYISSGSTGKMSKEIKSVLDAAERTKNQRVSDNKNKYGGITISYTDSEGNEVSLYYHEYYGLVAKEVKNTKGNTVYYDVTNKKIDGLPSKKEFEKGIKKRNEKMKNAVVDAVKEVKKNEDDGAPVTTVPQLNNLQIDGKPDFNDTKAWVTDNVYSQSGLYGQCTWFACGRFIETYGYSPGFTGDGKDCAQQLVNAHSDKFELSDTPKAGAIFSFLGSGSHTHGHTGIVTAVHDDGTITIQDGNYNGTTDSFAVAKTDWGTRRGYPSELAANYGGVVFANPKSV